MAIKLIPTIYAPLFWWRVTPHFFQITSLSALINYFPPVYQNNYVLRSLNCFAIVLLTWFGNSCVHYQPKYYYSAWYIHPFLEFNFSSGFFGLFCLFLCFLYDKINYIVLRNESEVITQGNLRPRPLMYWPSNSEVNTSRLRSAVILLQIQK